MNKSAMITEKDQDFRMRIYVSLIAAAIFAVTIYYVGMYIGQEMDAAGQRIQASEYSVTGEVDGIYQKYTVQGFGHVRPFKISYTIRVKGQNYELTDQMVHALVTGEKVLGQMVTISGDWKGVKSLQIKSTAK